MNLIEVIKGTHIRTGEHLQVNVYEDYKSFGAQSGFKRVQTMTIEFVFPQHMKRSYSGRNIAKALAIIAKIKGDLVEYRKMP